MVWRREGACLWRRNGSCTSPTDRRGQMDGPTSQRLNCPPHISKTRNCVPPWAILWKHSVPRRPEKQRPLDRAIERPWQPAGSRAPGTASVLLPEQQRRRASHRPPRIRPTARIPCRVPGRVTPPSSGSTPSPARAAGHAALPVPPRRPKLGHRGGRERRWPDPHRAWRICGGRPSAPSSPSSRDLQCWRRQPDPGAPSSVRAGGSEGQGSWRRGRFDVGLPLRHRAVGRWLHR